MQGSSRPAKFSESKLLQNLVSTIRTAADSPMSGRGGGQEGVRRGSGGGQEGVRRVSGGGQEGVSGDLLCGFRTQRQLASPVILPHPVVIIALQRLQIRYYPCVSNHSPAIAPQPNISNLSLLVSSLRCQEGEPPLKVYQA
eukprot:1190278-Prorocentrum_minimum.AAC.2